MQPSSMDSVLSSSSSAQESISDEELSTTAELTYPIKARDTGGIRALGVCIMHLQEGDKESANERKAEQRHIRVDERRRG